MTIRSKRILSYMICTISVVITTHFILMEPLHIRNETEENSKVFLHLEKRSFENHGFKNRVSKSCHNFVIFDAENENVNLSFLQKQSVGWCIIVVNLKHFSNLSTCVDCMVLSDEWIRKNVVKYVAKKEGNDSWPTNVQLSKMAAYLFALLQGAEWVYTTDRQIPVPYSLLTKVMDKQVVTGPVYTGPDEFFEPCSHFVDHLTWRGRKSGKVQRGYSVKVISSHSIYQIVDSCYKPGMEKDTQKISFDMEAPVPYLMPGTFAVADFRNVLVPRTSSWSLVASILSRNEREIIGNSRNDSMFGSSSTNTTLGIQMDILTQRMLWETDSRIGFIPGGLRQLNCPSCALYSQLQVTDPDYRKSLLNWRCEPFVDVRTCFLQMSSDRELSTKMLEAIVHAWMSILNQHAIPLVVRTPFSADTLIEKFKGIPLYYSPANILRTAEANNSVDNPFQNLCKRQKRLYQPVIPVKHPISNILLVIVFNFPFLVSHIPLLDYVYGRHFKHVLYCGESMSDFEKRYQHLHPDKPVSFVEIHHYMGYWGQNCMSAGIKMGYDVTGYLQISDDVIMNIWNFDKLPFRQPWFQSNMRVAHIDRDIVPDVWINRYWWPWSQFSGKQSAMAAYNHLESLLSHSVDGDKISTFMENLYNITNCNRCFLYEASDIFYLPRELASNFTFFSDIFSYNKVFLEITIPTVLSGITSDREVYRLRGNYLWFHDRERYPFVYTEFDHFYHAWKLSLFGDPRQVQFFCRRILARIDRHLRKGQDRIKN